MFTKINYITMAILFGFNMAFDFMADVVSHRPVQWLTNLGLSLMSIMIYMVLNTLLSRLSSK